MKTIIIFNEVNNHLNEIVGGIYTGIDHKTAAAEIGKNNILYFIPLRIAGKSYQERKNNLEETAKEWQRSNYDFIDWSYSELAEIQSFFEANGKRYGLIKEFTENGII